MVEKNTMSEEQEPVCFTCGHTTGGTLRLNCLPSGQVCPTCRDRLLECLPPILPADDGSLAAGPRAEGSAQEAERVLGPQPSPMGPGQILHGSGPDEPA